MWQSLYLKNFENITYFASATILTNTKLCFAPLYLLKGAVQMYLYLLLLLLLLYSL